MKALLSKTVAYFKKDKPALPATENDQKKDDKMPVDNCPSCNGNKLKKLVEGRFHHRLQCVSCKAIIKVDKNTGEVYRSQISA